MIDSVIVSECLSLLSTIFFGMVLAFAYDGIRIFRRVVIHRHMAMMAVEDILYWICAAFVAFSVIYEKNHGIIRGFNIAGFFVGAVLYRYTAGNYFVTYVSKLLLILLKPLKKFLKWIIIKVHKGADFFLGTYKKVTDLLKRKGNGDEV